MVIEEFNKMEQILHKIAQHHQLTILEVLPLAGGDINAVYLLKCDPNSYVIKLNSDLKFPGMFKAEAKGLEVLRNSKSFRVPEVLGYGEIQGRSYLIIDYIDLGIPDNDFWMRFAENLAVLHQTSSLSFGLDHDNYIGSLVQYNKSEKTASNFYIHQRLEPQLKMAYKQGFRLTETESFFKNISEEIPQEEPSLVHGDLWNGNYLVSNLGEAVLIDPAVAFAPREMDIAMMHLFGGFNESLFQEYNEIFPLAPGWHERIPIWQLYYLLVHLNLFGSGYLSQVQSIIKKFS